MSPLSRLPAGLGSLIAPDLGRSLRRFPLPCAFGILLTAVVILEQYDVRLAGLMQDRLRAGLVAAALAALSVDLLAEGRRWPSVLRFGLHLAVIGAIAGLHLAAMPWRVSDTLLIPGLLLLVSVAGFLRPQASFDAFWRFNERLWLSAGLALLGAGAFAIGIFAIDRSLAVLFGIDFDEIVSRIVFPVAFCALAPLTWLSSVPRLDAPEELAPDHFLDRAVRLIARFVLVPLLLTYAVILLAYALQIAVSWRLPEGQIGWMVSAFGSVGALTILLLHPERHAAGRPVRWFMRWWFALTIVPVGLLVLAIQLRVEAFGLTAPRYALMLMAAWLAAMAVLFARSGTRERDIRLIPGLAALLLLAGSFGPWGAASMGVSSQIGQFLALSRAKGWMEGERLDPDAILAALSHRSPAPEAEAERARSILDHIAAEDGLGMIARRLDNPEALERLAARDRDLRGAFARQLGPEPQAPVSRPRPVKVAPAKGFRDIAPYAVLYGPVRLGIGDDRSVPGSLSGTRVEYGIAGRGRIEFDLAPTVPEDEGEPVTVPAFVTARQQDGSGVGVVILDAAGLWMDGTLELQALQFLLMFSEETAARRPR